MTLSPPAWSGLDRGSPSANVARWNSTIPPPYSYSPVTAPVALYWGQKDNLVVPQDEMDLAGRYLLSYFCFFVYVPKKKFSHSYFLLFKLIFFSLASKTEPFQQLVLFSLNQFFLLLLFLPFFRISPSPQVAQPSYQC